MKLDKKIINDTPEVLPKEVFETLTDICNIGNRWPGTDGEKRTYEYLQNKLSLFADEIELEDFLYPEYKPVSSKCEIKLPIKEILNCNPVGYSENGSVEGKLIYIGEGTEKDIELLIEQGIIFNKKIALARTLRPYNVCNILNKLGVKGIIIISDAPFGKIRHLTSQMGFSESEDLNKFGAPIPGVIISQNDGERILSILSSKEVIVKIEHNSLIEIKNSLNIIANIEGKNNSDEKVIIGAHYDTQLDIQGAWDNGSGCAALVEICRIYSKNRPRRSMTFCAFGCEENGLFGSTNFVRNRKEKIKNIISYSNLDSTSSDVAFIHRILASENALEFLVKIISDNTEWNPNQYRAFTKWDHEQDCGEFFRFGVSSLWASEEGNPFFHTKFDDIKTVSPENLARSTRVSLLPFHYLANTSEIPFVITNR